MAGQDRPSFQDCDDFLPNRDPAMNRWASLECPCGTRKRHVGNFGNFWISRLPIAVSPRLERVLLTPFFPDCCGGNAQVDVHAPLRNWACHPLQDWSGHSTYPCRNSYVCR